MLYFREGIMRYLWGGLSLVFFFGAIALFILVVVDGRNAAIGTIASFVVLLLSYFSQRIARRYP